MERRFEVVSQYREAKVNLPRRKTKWSAGYDLEAAAAVTVEPGELALIPTGLKAYMERDEVLMLFIRSSLAVKQGLILANGTGIIDADYVDNPDNEGHIQLAVRNLSSASVTIDKGQAIAQGIFLKYLLTTNDEPGQMRLGGFGSTDQNKT